VHSRVGGGVDAWEFEADGLLFGFRSFFLGFLRLAGFGFLEKDSAKAGDFFLGDVFGVGLLLGRSDE
jgi:hypothetical protein